MKKEDLLEKQRHLNDGNVNMSTERELGEHSVAIEHMQQDMDRLIVEVNGMKIKIDKIDKALDEIRGGWKVLIWIAAGVGGTISWVVTHWFGK
jgi:hypothetical protein